MSSRIESTPDSEAESKSDQPNVKNIGLKNLLHQRLVECGWRDALRRNIRSVLERRGVNNVSYKDVAAEVLPKARALVPDNLSEELQMIVRNALESTDLTVKRK